MQTRKIAIPVAEGKLVAEINHAQQFYIYDTKDYGIVKETMELAPAEHSEDFSKWLKGFGITEIVAQEMAQPQVDAFIAAETNVILGAPLMAPKDLAIDYLKQVEMMDAQAGGGCCGGGGGHNHGHDHNHDHGGGGGGCGCH